MASLRSFEAVFEFLSQCSNHGALFFVWWYFSVRGYESGLSCRAWISPCFCIELFPDNGP